MDNNSIGWATEITSHITTHIGLMKQTQVAETLLRQSNQILKKRRHFYLLSPHHACETHHFRLCKGHLIKKICFKSHTLIVHDRKYSSLSVTSYLVNNTSFLSCQTVFTKNLIYDCKHSSFNVGRIHVSLFKWWHVEGSLLLMESGVSDLYMPRDSTTVSVGFTVREHPDSRSAGHLCSTDF